MLAKGLGYRALIHWLVEALTKKQERLHMAMATGVLCVKLDKESRTQSRTMDDWPVACSVWNTLGGAGGAHHNTHFNKHVIQLWGNMVQTGKINHTEEPEKPGLCSDILEIFLA